MSLVNLVVSDVKQVIKRFHEFHDRFADYFATKTRNMSEQGKQYMHGQLLCQNKGNMKEFEKIVPDSNDQSLNHFVSNSPWEDEPVIDSIEKTVSMRIGDPEHGGIHVDESGLPKQGKDSVGVNSQYCGRLGKVANCQMGVFLGYTHNSYRMLMDKRLYLPQEWIDDHERRKKCGVPEGVIFQTKAQLGLEMVREAQKRGVPFGWVGLDCHYGQQQWLLAELEGDRLVYIADTPCDTRVWLEQPKTEVPPRKGNSGRIPTILRVAEGEEPPVEVRKLAPQLDEHQWERVFVRDTERKELWARIACLRVYPVRDGLPGPQTWLILRQDEGKEELKYQFCNASEDTPLQRLAEMSHSRYWMERAIQDAKGEVGLAEYEHRGWRGWHHHMVMTFLAMLFLLELQLDWITKAPNLTLQDVREILEVMLPKRKITPAGILKIIEEKHKDRLSARRSHHRRHKNGTRNLM